MMRCAWMAAAVVLVSGMVVAAPAAPGTPGARDAGAPAEPRPPYHTDDARDDDRMTDRLNRQLASDEALEDSNIQVETQHLVVTLRGTVPSEAARRRALDTARALPNVARVDDQLVISTKR